jgi:ArsR family transcriptional regulator
MKEQNLELEVSLLHERVCAALSDATRIMILYLLAEKALFVNEIAEALATPQSTISRHLRILRERSLVDTEREGTSVRYSLKDRRIIEALDLLRALLSDQIQADAAITQKEN